MYATSIENKPKTYARPTLIGTNFMNIVASEPSEDPPSEDESELIIEYKFDTTPNNSHSGYNLTPVGSIQYNTSPNSVELNGSSYLSVDIDFEVKTLSFWFNLPDVNIDNYLLSFDTDFYIKANANSLEFQSCNITRDFSSNIWYNLALTSNNANYDIYLDNTKLPETIRYKDVSSSTLNIGKYTDDAEIEIDNSGITNFIGCNMKDHSMVVIDDHMYVFGGSSNVSLYAGDINFNDLYKIDTDGNFATVILSGVIPPARSQHSMVVIDSNIYIFGGYSDGYVPNYLYKIDTTNNNNSETITLTGSDIPSRRFGHSMVVIDDDIYIFGGFYGGYKNDLYRITTLGSCEKITLTGSDDNKPSSRQFHSMVVIDNNMYIFGGLNDTVLKDLYKINTTGNSEKINITGDIPKRYSHTMVAIGDYMYIFGGSSFDNVCPNDLYRIDTTGYSKKITLDVAKVPVRRSHTMVIIDDHMYIFGGFGNSELDDLIKIPFTFKPYYLNGKIADLRLYNYPLTDISTIYDEFFNTIPTDFTITFENQTIGSHYMLSTVPAVTTELNIINDSILYNSEYEEGSGLYIDFTKPNLHNVVKVTITNNGTIYGRGGIGQRSSVDNRRDGKYAITVLNTDDNINREITITNNGYIYGGGNGGDYIASYEYTYTYTYTYTLTLSSQVYTNNKKADILINGQDGQGGDAQYYDGAYVISAESPYILSGDTIYDGRPTLPSDSGPYSEYSYTEESYADITIDSNGGQDFDEGKIIDLPSNDLVSVSYT